MTDRPRTVALYHLRTLQIGLSWTDLFYIREGEILDMITEMVNDHAKYDELATQEDFDHFG